MKSLGLQVMFPISALVTVVRQVQDAGYNQVNIDDCWSERKRSDDGFLVPGEMVRFVFPCGLLTGVLDKVRFKSGLKKLTDQLHAMGL